MQDLKKNKIKFTPDPIGTIHTIQTQKGKLPHKVHI